MPPSTPAPKYDTEFYPDTITFLTDDNVLFDVPKRPFLTRSTLFAEEHKIGATPSFKNSGALDQNVPVNPISLQVDAESFRAFCKALCPRDNYQVKFTLAQLLSVLKLASAWRFNDIRQVALESFITFQSKLSVFEKIDRGQQLNISAWVMSGYTELVTRSSPIAFDEAEKLGWQTAISLTAIRENCIHAKYGKKGSFPTLEEQITSAFQSEFDRFYLTEQHCMMPKEREQAEEVRLKKVQAAEEAKRERECERLRAELAEKEKRQKKENEDLAKQRETLKALEAASPATPKPVVVATAKPLVFGPAKPQAEPVTFAPGSMAPNPPSGSSSSLAAAPGPSVVPQPAASTPLFPPNNSPFAALKQNTVGQGLGAFATQNTFNAGANSPFGVAPANVTQVPSSNAPFSFK
ncbi:hypothetical protein DFP72DRAFT_1165564 [Ephemerocybe angulata]|uniref:Uncharacterized protein n=1 Tax=Ephemerocybe angulata TaxID=980116 RepID=A0A8H6MEI8_9AGAR|nr:hypothetical protein DFP72DRAFT_1165564 [Tulosesus angulatus]